MLEQVNDGSILVFHMPEKSFRRHTLQTLELVLNGLAERGLACVTLSALVDGAGRGDRAGAGSDRAEAESLTDGSCLRDATPKSADDMPARRVSASGDSGYAVGTAG